MNDVEQITSRFLNPSMKSWKSYAVFFGLLSLIWLGTSIANYFYGIEILPDDFRKRVGGSWGWGSFGVGMTLFMFAKYLQTACEALKTFRIFLIMSIAICAYDLIQYFYTHSISEMFVIPVLHLITTGLFYIYCVTILDLKRANKFASPES